MEKRELICIGCPMGCMLTATIKKDIISIEGNNCKIGIDYGINECKDPRRAITTSIRVNTKNGIKMLSLKTDKDIPKNKIFECLSEIKKIKIDKSIFVGDIVVENILNLNSNIVATRNLN